jgi:hypothetical protein
MFQFPERVAVRRQMCGRDKRETWLLALTLLVTGILAADDVNHTATLDNLAVVAHPLDRCSDLHGWYLFGLFGSLVDLTPP